MRPLLLVFALASLTTLVAQNDGADPAAIAHIRAVYNEINDTTTGLEIQFLDDGTEVAKREDKIRRIVTYGTDGESYSYYYTSLGNPLFLFVQSADKEERFYFDPQLDDGPGRLRMIRWVENKKHHKPTGKTFETTGNDKLAEAFNLLHRAQGELEFTAEVYDAIRKRLTRMDQKIDARKLLPIDTISQLEDDFIATDGEPENPCWDDLITYDLDGATLRTVQSSGCDGGHTVYSTNQTITDFDNRGQKLREASVLSDFQFEDRDGKGIMNWGTTVTINTYFDDDLPVYELTISEHQGLEVFQRLKILEE